jgi:hypothetical protein
MTDHGLTATGSIRNGPLTMPGYPQARVKVTEGN